MRLVEKRSAVVYAPLFHNEYRLLLVHKFSDRAIPSHRVVAIFGWPRHTHYHQTNN